MASFITLFPSTTSPKHLSIILDNSPSSPFPHPTRRPRLTPASPVSACMTRSLWEPSPSPLTRPWNVPYACPFLAPLGNIFHPLDAASRDATRPSNDFHAALSASLQLLWERSVSYCVVSRAVVPDHHFQLATPRSCALPPPP
ncbi:hypothetical protein PYCCODRAFT_282057 [Trametes coccinea BRFM310]|uniref:Uncharacterized protein n=1 Tax=Trametes coccinea (strain BRFM310) TaxID=1353009 RepID=A0A1Y2IPH6_TRAC3|nr:hypothetical protein PYCCODRAFT_282057 [Trametes coccinea BRFM310]